MMRLKKNRNKLVLMGVGVWFGVAIGFFAWFGVQADNYRAQTKTYRAEVARLLADSNDALKRAHDESPTAMRDVLVMLANSLEVKTKQSPAAPGVLGMRIGADDTYTKQARLDAAVRTYAADIRTAVDFIDYQQKTAFDLQLLTLKSAGNADQIFALATVWGETITSVTARTAPPQMKEVSATLLQKLADAKTVIQQLGDLHKANDETGFTAKYAKLTSIIATFKPLGDQIAVVAAQIDAKLAQDIATISKNL